MIRLLPFALIACVGATQARDVSFVNDVMPILNDYCIMCHLPGAEQGGLGLYPDAWEKMVGVRSKQSPLLLVDPGAPDDSYLYIKLIDSGESVGGSGRLMPVQQPPLNEGQITMVRRWIEQGAQKN